MQTKRVPYTFNRRGYFYFSRRVPNDLIDHYLYPRVVQSLRTKQSSIARTRSQMLAAKLDEHWSNMRLAHADIPGKHLLRQPIEIRASSRSGYAADVTSMGLNEAVDVYLKLKGASKSKTFHAATHRACGYLVDACGMKHLHEYNRGDALAFRDALVARGLAGSSVSRVFNSVTAVFNFAVSEHALNISNPFTGVYHDRTAGVSKRHPIPLPDIRKVQILCKKQDDDARWLIALVSDTGLRLAEAAGVLTNDLKVDAEIL